MCFLRYAPTDVQRTKRRSSSPKFYAELPLSESFSPRVASPHIYGCFSTFTLSASSTETSNPSMYSLLCGRVSRIST